MTCYLSFISERHLLWIQNSWMVGISHPSPIPWILNISFYFFFLAWKFLLRSLLLIILELPHREPAIFFFIFIIWLLEFSFCLWLFTIWLYVGIVLFGLNLVEELCSFTWIFTSFLKFEILPAMIYLNKLYSSFIFSFPFKSYDSNVCSIVSVP